MRGAFGLVALLVTVGVIVFVYSQITIPTVRQGVKTQDQAAQIAGFESRTDQTMATDAVQTDAVMKGGQLHALRVTNVTPGSAMERNYGLQVGDEIVEIGNNGSMTPIGTYGDESTVRALLLDTYRGNWPMVVIRGGQRVTLTPAVPGAGPAPAAGAPPAAGTSPAANAPAQPAAPTEEQPKKSSGGLGGVYDQIQDIQNNAAGQ